MTKKNRFILISILILYVALLIGTFFALMQISDWKHEGKILDETVQLQTIMDCYEQAKIYKEERVGDKYELHSIGGEMSSDKDEITFTYTKRKGMFKDVYFITVDRIEKKIIVTGQAGSHLGTVIFWYCFCGSSKRNILTFKRRTSDLLNA